MSRIRKGVFSADATSRQYVDASSSVRGVRNPMDAPFVTASCTREVRFGSSFIVLSEVRHSMFMIAFNYKIIAFKKKLRVHRNSELAV